jgi:hypothetical protein
VNLESRATFQVTVGEEGYYSWDQVNPLTTSSDSPETLSPFMGAESPEVESSFVLCRSETDEVASPVASYNCDDCLDEFMYWSSQFAVDDAQV